MIPPEMVAQLVVTVFSATITTIAAYLLYKMQEKERQREHDERERKIKEEREEENRQREYAAIKNGLMAMLRDRLIQCCEAYEQKGWVPLHSFENISLLYSAYHEMGGNGVVTQLYDDLKDLPHHSLATEEEGAK